MRMYGLSACEVRRLLEALYIAIDTEEALIDAYELSGGCRGLVQGGASVVHESTRRIKAFNRLQAKFRTPAESGKE
jgi:hypothetical protein